MFPPAESNSDFSQNTQFSKWVFWLQVSYQKLLDDVTPWLQARWAATAVLLVIYILRVWFFGGWYIVSYALGIYMLNLLIGFLSPKVDPEMDVDADSTGTLPLNKDDEYRPFVRKLPEFKFW